MGAGSNFWSAGVWRLPLGKRSLDVSGHGHSGTNDGAAPVFGSTVTNPGLQHGTITNNGDGTITYAPNPGFDGTDRFGYTVQDDVGTISNLAIVTIHVIRLDPWKVVTQVSIGENKRKLYIREWHQCPYP